MEKFVLMLEDDLDDRKLTRETLDQTGLSFPIRFTNSSDAFFQQLEEGPLPSLLLVDYNAVPDNALTVLRRLKSEDRFASIPVIVLSDSDLPRYKEACYRLGAASFIRKPVTMEETRKKIETFFNYWLEVAEL
jgi:CheY-like chemotaxis protein